MTLGDADFIKSPMKMIYREFPKTASLPVTCDQRSELYAHLKDYDKNFQL